MLKVADLIKLLSGHSLNMSPILVTFINYLQNSYRSEELFSRDLLQNFINECVEYPHWQQNSIQLTEELQNILGSSIGGFFDLRELQNIRWPKDIQVIEIQSATDMADLVSCFLNRQTKGSEKVQVVFDPLQKKVLGFVLSENAHISIRIFNNKFVVNNGHLEPLRTDLILRYDKNLELLEKNPQKFEVSNYSFARFIMDDGLVFGSVNRGYIFQKSLDLKGQPLEAYAKLFLSLKRIEQFFIKKESDPFYISLIQGLEKAILAAKLENNQGLQDATDILVRAQNAAEYVFVGDKLLQLLIRDLQLLLENKALPKSRLTLSEQIESSTAPSVDTPRTESMAKWQTQKLDLIN